MMTPNEAQLDHLRADILEVCTEQTLSISEILASEPVAQQVEPYGSALVKHTIRALATSGLLFSRGNRRGTLYRSTKIGRDTILAFRNRQYHQPSC